MSVEALGDGSPLDADGALRAVWSGQPLLRRGLARWRRLGSVPVLRAELREQELLWCPLWLARTLVTADRPPFPPRRSAVAVFVDGLSGYAGLLGGAAPTAVVDPVEGRVLAPVLDEEQARDRVTEVQRQQIDRSYPLRKPRHRIESVRLVHLPVRRLHLAGPRAEAAGVAGSWHVNAVSGELETHLAREWSRAGQEP